MRNQIKPGQANDDRDSIARLRDLERRIRRIPSRWSPGSVAPKQAWIWDGNTVFSGDQVMTNGTQGTSYNQSPSTTGGFAATSWTVGTGTLPPGLSINSTTGAITGTPTSAGSNYFTLVAHGSGGTTQNVPIAVTINQTGDTTTQASGTDVYGCRKYTGTDITAESPAALPAVGISTGAGAYASGVAGICRIYLGVDSTGAKIFALGYSPSIPYWLITDQPVVLGGSISTTGGTTVYAIQWGV